ncbi:EEF1A lysine methyltransferase 1 [Aphomia sociella]
MSTRIMNGKFIVALENLNEMEDDDDVPTLSAETFAALQEFYVEQQKRQEILTKLEADDKLKENILFDENWQLSQFWYDEATVQTLVKAVDKSVTDGARVALISCPTLFVPIKRQIGSRATVTLLEYDRRFEVHSPDFIFYDYNTPEKLPPETFKSYDLVVADPPFLSEECITKTSQTIKLLAKDKIVVCTGAIMREHVEKLLDLKLCKFQPRHRNNLANEFSCYANFDVDSILR